MNKTLRTVFSFVAMMAVVFSYAIISQNENSTPAVGPTDTAIEEVTLDLTKGSVKVALVDVYETIGSGEAVEKPAYRAGGSRKGKLVLTAPAGCAKMSFSAVMAKGMPDQNLIVTIDGNVVGTFAVKANDGITGYAPYNVAFADEAAKEAATFSIDLPLTGQNVDVAFELETSSRFVIWDLKSSQLLKTGKYFFKNLATGKFWGAANDWGTHASLVDNPEFMTLEKLADGNYKLETNVNNGGTQYYFNGAWMDNGSPVSLQVLDRLDYFTIGDGNVFFGYNGQNTYMGNDGNNTSTNPNDDNVKWQIVSESEIGEYLAEASETAPINATFFIKDANFGRNNRDVGAWQVSSNCTNKNLSGGNNNNNNAESFHSAFKINQVIEGVPNGVYSMTAQGFYRQDGTDNENLPVFFLNEDEITFPEKTGTENSMSDASVSFSNGNYTTDMLVVKVTDGKLNVGVKLENNTNLWCIWDNFTLFYYGENADVEVVKFAALKSQLAALVEQANALDCAGLPAVYPDAVAAALQSAAAPTTTAEYREAINALTAAISNVNTAKNAQVALAAMKAEMDATNVYTAEAFEKYQGIYNDGKAAFEAGTPVAVVNPQGLMAWHAANDIDDLLLSAWTINDVQCQEFNTSLYINTWSVEGETDGSEFKVPFFEYWTGDDQSLGAATLTATVPNLAAGEYEVNIWARVRIKNGAEAPTYGITMDVNGGEAVDLCAGENVPGAPFYLAQFTATGVVGSDGVLKININVADNNISWLSFKNVNYVALLDPQKTYEDALATLKSGQTYRIFAEQGDAKYYLNETGYLVADAAEAATFTFNSVVADGTLYGTGWNLGCKFTNPETYGQTTFENEGHIRTGSNDRNDWERQVFFMNSEGKYAVRATNADNPAWGSNTYWDVFEGEALPEAGYSLEPAYVWNVEEFVDVRPAALAKIGNWLPTLQQSVGLVQDASKYTSNAKDPSEGSYEALIDNNYATFFHSTWHTSNDPNENHYLQAEIEEPVSEFYFFFKKRSQNNNNRPTQIDITAGDDLEFGLDEVTSITEGLPVEEAVISYLSEKISLDAASKYIRFTVPATNNGAKTGDYVFFTFSEFYLLPASDIMTEIIESGLLDVTSYKSLTDEDIAKVEAIDAKIQQLAEEVRTKKAYENALATLVDGKTYRIFTEKDGQKYYLNTAGYLVEGSSKAPTFTFTAVKAGGTTFETGWNLGCKFTNPETYGQTTFENEGRIRTGSNDRNDWERQVFFLNAEGKYAVRATNADNPAWGGNTYWDVFDGVDLPEAGYSLAPAYVWQVEEYVDARPAYWAKIDTWAAKLQAAEGLVQDAANYSSNAPEPNEGSLANLLDYNYTTFFHSMWSGAGPDEDHYLQAVIEEPVTEFYFYFKKRHNNDVNRPTQINISAGDDEVFGLDEVTSITEGLPTDPTVISYISEKVTLPSAAKIIRFTVPSTNNGATNASSTHPFFTFSEFYLLPANDLVVAAAEFMGRGGYVDLEESEFATIDEIDAAINAINAKDGSLTGVRGIEVAGEDAKVYDLTGRRIVKTTKGIFIVNGKKVVK